MIKNKHSFDSLFLEGTRLLHEGKPEESLPKLEQAYALDSNHVDAAINLGGAYILTKRFRQAVSVLEPLSNREPENAMIWTNLGAAYLGNPVLARDEDQLRAINAFKRALEIDPDAPNVAYNIALIYQDRKEVRKARKWYRQALKSNPGDVHALRKLESLETLVTGDG